ncbi:MAG: hypothetical protein ACXVBW_14525 [Bdellovibrionota bacterium]
MGNRKRKISAAGAFLLATATIVAAAATSSYQFTGKVIRVGDQTVTVQNAAETRDFDRSKLDPKISASLKPGETVTVQYRMEALQIRKQEAGSRDTGDADAEKIKKGTIKDDRTFWNAGNAVPNPRQS